jgi:fructose-1,6-bisphosphatase I
MEERNKTLGEFIIENQNAFNIHQANYPELLTLFVWPQSSQLQSKQSGTVVMLGQLENKTYKGKTNKKLDVYANEVYSNAYKS